MNVKRVRKIQRLDPGAFIWRHVFFLLMKTSRTCSAEQSQRGASYGARITHCNCLRRQCQERQRERSEAEYDVASLDMAGSKMRRTWNPSQVQRHVIES